MLERVTKLDFSSHIVVSDMHYLNSWQFVLVRIFWQLSFHIQMLETIKSLNTCCNMRNTVWIRYHSYCSQLCFVTKHQYINQCCPLNISNNAFQTSYFIAITNTKRKQGVYCTSIKQKVAGQLLTYVLHIWEVPSYDMTSKLSRTRSPLYSFGLSTVQKQR